jgi:hypothetical protein
VLALIKPALDRFVKTQSALMMSSGVNHVKAALGTFVREFHVSFASGIDEVTSLISQDQPAKQRKGVLPRIFWKGGLQEDGSA